MDKVISFVFIYLFMFLLNKLFNRIIKHGIKLFKRVKEYLEK